ncbi:zinc transport system ATP-binding protein [Marmoricola sp. OAE513]|uniref:metal ABC transporter ATP-binding protein n=1 Tax=Marmoricola sp. OAE513 TaxID=2817894 RepID=UPI001AE2A7D7
MSTAPNPVLEVTGGSVEIAGRPILRDVDLRVDPGEVVALLGANGSGKSTLVKTVAGLLPLSAGEVRLFGVPLTGFRSWSRLGYVPQRSPMAQGVPSTVREVVASGRLSRRRPFVPERAADRAAVHAALEAVGLSDRAQHPVGILSGGQQQRVLLARTLAGEPDLLLLDEPLAGVDLVSQDALAATLEHLTERGTTVVVVLHELGPLEPLIQRAVTLREGRVSYDGDPSGAPGHGHGHAHCEPSAASPSPVPGVVPGGFPGVAAPLGREG